MIPKAVWKYAVLEFGVQSVITPGVTLMPMLYVDNLDTLVRVFKECIFLCYYFNSL